MSIINPFPIGPQGPAGADGEDGADGQDGQDGADAAAPTLYTYSTGNISGNTNTDVLLAIPAHGVVESASIQRTSGTTTSMAVQIHCGVPGGATLYTQVFGTSGTGGILFPASVTLLGPQIINTTGLRNPVCYGTPDGANTDMYVRFYPGGAGGAFTLKMLIRSLR
jgi:hypothetical protein